VRLLTGRGRPAVSTPGQRRVLSTAVKSTAARGTAVKGTGPGFVLVATGAILVFAVRADAGAALNWHIVGIIAIVMGALRLLMLPTTGPGAPRPDRLQRLINPSGVDDPDVNNVQVAAAIDAREIREDESSFSPGGPGRQRDEL
jgi:hypothetical protein